MTSWAEQNADPRMDDLTPSGRCLCRECGEFFNSVKPFRLHRYQIILGKSRGCHDVEWMESKCWERSSKGFWITESHDAESLQATIT